MIWLRHLARREYEALDANVSAETFPAPCWCEIPPRSLRGGIASQGFSNLPPASPRRSKILKIIDRSAQLDSDGQLISQELRSKICAVWPDESTQRWMQSKLAKRLQISEWLEHGSCELTCEVHLAFGAVIEAKPDLVVADVLGLDDMQ